MGPELLSLPIAFQIALGSGYLAYLLAYSGIRQHHSAADATFRSLAFGLASSAVLYFTPLRWWSIALAILAPLPLAAFWRWRGMFWARALFRKVDVSWADDLPSAWLSIVAERTDARPSQIAIDLDNGRTLLCDDTRLFSDAPYGPCVLGLDGSVALYVTSERRENGEWFDHEDVRHPVEGDRLTYVPASAIKRVEMRYWTKAIWKAAPAVGTAMDSAEAPEASVAAPNPGHMSA